MVHDIQSRNATSWKRRFEALHLLDVKMAPAACRGLVASKQSGVSQLYAWDLNRKTMTQLTHRASGVLEGFLSPDGQFVYYLDDDRGNEIGHFVRVPFEGSIAVDVTPHLPPYAPAEFAISTNGSLAAFIAARETTYTLHLLDLGPDGTIAVPRTGYESSSLMWGAEISYTGDVVVFASTERTKRPEYNLVAIDSMSGDVLNELWDGPNTSIWPLAFAPIAGDLRFLAMSNRTGCMRPLVWDIRSNEREDLPLDLDGEVRPFAWSPDGRTILLSHIHRAVQRLYLYIFPERQLVRLDHPSGLIQKACFGPDHQIFALWQSETHPPQILNLDSRTGRATEVAVPAPETPRSHPWTSIEVPSSDGQLIQAWLGQPGGLGPFPTILHIHGGPAAFVSQSFSPELQTWLDHGFAICSVNYRGSLTFGRVFETQIHGNPGVFELEDILAVRAWLVEHGIARVDQILLTGNSYGGYLSLLALGKHPDAWAGGMVRAPITDWTIQYQESSGRMRGFQTLFLGGTPDEQPERYRTTSPITYVTQVKAPVLIMQGYQDTRTPARAVEAYVAKMHEHNKQVEVHYFDSGHAGVRADMSREIELQTQMLQFATRILR